MKLVQWTDKRGYKHLSLLRDGDPDKMAPAGISRDPPDINALDWAQIKRDLHNLLVDLHLTSWRDVQGSKASITSAVLGALRRPVCELYKMKEVKARKKK